ncbi:MAG: hypothetical protein ABSF50_23185 [Burkholderiaceae bacterium]|jgi:hypothetical protein
MHVLVAVVAGANVLLSMFMRSVLMWLEADDILSLHWSQDISEERVRNLARSRGEAFAKFSALVDAREQVLPDTRVKDHHKLDGIFGRSDPKDRHVA